jgi:hypothetical protein
LVEQSNQSIALDFPQRENNNRGGLSTNGGSWWWPSAFRSLAFEQRRNDMPKTIESLKKSWFGLLLIGFLCTTLTVQAVPHEAAAQTDDEGLSGGKLAALLLAIGGAVAGIFYASRPDAPELFDHLQAAIDDARLAEGDGDRTGELSAVSEAIGAAKALRAQSSCDACGDARNDLQEVMGILAKVKTDLIGASRTCRPDGRIGPHEQCDPLAVPTGCPQDGTVLLFCNDECQCQVPID